MKKNPFAYFAVAAAMIFTLAAPAAAQAGPRGFYSDRQLMVATQIAYYDFTQEQLARHGGSVAVRELLSEGNTREKLVQDVSEADTELKKKMEQGDLALYDEIVAPGCVYGDWRVVDVKNLNVETGFYGVLLETDPRHAIIGFRGSESTDRNQILKDWINADAGLLMDRDTIQQTKAAEYMAEIEQRFSYEQYAVTGHSLGGNLAEHAAIAAPDSMRPKLVQVVSFDGPGYSKEYMTRHQDLISRVIYPISHYRWSLVGALLTQPACTVSRIVQVTEDVRSVLDADASYMRHATTYLAFEDGQVTDGTEDLVSRQMGEWSLKADEKAIQLRKEHREGKSAGPGA